MTTQNQLLREALRDAVTLFACRCTDSTARNWFERAQAAIAAQPAEPLSPLLVRDVAEMIGSTVPDVCKALVQLGHGQRSTNAAVHPEEAIAVAKLLAQPADLTPDALLRRIQASPFRDDNALADLVQRLIARVSELEAQTSASTTGNTKP